MIKATWTKFFAALVLVGTACDTMHAESKPGSTIPATTIFASGEAATTLVELMTNRGDRWTGTVLLSTNAETDKAAALAAWIRSAKTAPPIQATGGWLKP
jgi:hypothetical protein